MKKGQVKLGLVAFVVCASFAMMSCEKEVLTKKSEAELREDNQDCGTPEMVIFDVKGEWVLESISTSSGIVTAEEMEVVKKVYFTEDQAHFYEDDILKSSKNYALHNGVGQFGAEVVIMVIDGDDFTYEAEVSEEEVLTLSEKDCLDPVIKKYIIK